MFHPYRSPLIIGRARPAEYLEHYWMIIILVLVMEILWLWLLKLTASSAEIVDSWVNKHVTVISWAAVHVFPAGKQAFWTYNFQKLECYCQFIVMIFSEGWGQYQITGSLMNMLWHRHIWYIRVRHVFAHKDTLAANR